MGTVIKCHAVYATPFWRAQGLNCSVTCLDEVVELAVDNSVPGSERGIITSLIHADRAKSWLKRSDEERKQVLLNAYAKLFGEQALHPQLYHDYSFTNNPWIGGAYSGYFKNGVFSQYGEHIAKPFGNIYTGRALRHLLCLKGLWKALCFQEKELQRKLFRKLQIKILPHTSG